MRLTFALDFSTQVTKEMTYTSRPTRAGLRSIEIPKNHATDFESDRYTRENL